MSPFRLLHNNHCISKICFSIIIINIQGIIIFNFLSITYAYVIIIFSKYSCFFLPSLLIVYAFLALASCGVAIKIQKGVYYALLFERRIYAYFVCEILEQFQLDACLMTISVAILTD